MPRFPHGTKHVRRAARFVPCACNTVVVLSKLFGDPATWPRQDLIAVSEDFDAQIVVEAYAAGVFPMPVEPSYMGWWSPVQRGVLPLGRLRITRSLRQSAKRYTTTVNRRFGAVLARCADESREGAWIDRRIADVFTNLHRAGVAHSVETWDAEGRLVGGLYGVHFGGLFAGESMFHDPARGRDASKVALLRLALQLHHVSVSILDVQWLTGHLASMGAVEIPRANYLARLDAVLAQPTQLWEDERLDGPTLLARLDAVRKPPASGAVHPPT